MERDKREEEQMKKTEDKAAEQHHMAAPEVEERAAHEYEGEGIGRRESLHSDDLPKVHHKEGEAHQK